jgi:hypothetical protein
MKCIKDTYWKIMTICMNKSSNHLIKFCEIWSWKFCPESRQMHFIFNHSGPYFTCHSYIFNIHHISQEISTSHSKQVNNNTSLSYVGFNHLFTVIQNVQWNMSQTSGCYYMSHLRVKNSVTSYVQLWTVTALQAFQCFKNTGQYWFLPTSFSSPPSL